MSPQAPGKVAPGFSNNLAGRTGRGGSQATELQIPPAQELHPGVLEFSGVRRCGENRRRSLNRTKQFGSARKQKNPVPQAPQLLLPPTTDPFPRQMMDNLDRTPRSRCPSAQSTSRLGQPLGVTQKAKRGLDGYGWDAFRSGWSSLEAIPLQIRQHVSSKLSGAPAFAIQKGQEA